MSLSPFPRTDPVTAGDRLLTKRWAEWILDLYTVVQQLATGRASVALVTTASEPDAVADRILIYADGTTLKVKYPDGTIRTVTVT